MDTLLQGSENVSVVTYYLWYDTLQFVLGLRYKTDDAI